MAENKPQNAPAEERELTEKEIGEQRQIKRKKLEELREMGRDPYLVETFDVSAHSGDIKDSFEAMEDQEVRVAGRIMAFRRMGKVAFVDLQDKQGRIQIFVARDNIGQEEYNVFKTYDVGDIIGVTGVVFKTKTGEISVRAMEVQLLCKSLQVLPNKWHGLKDTDLRYRQRYVDLIMNEDVRDTFRKRAKIISTMRKVLEEDYDLMEVETPVLGNIAGGAAARPFWTHHNTLDIDMTLRISLELHLKRLIVGGLDGVYEIGKVFRNEGMDKNHSPEFTSMEAYKAYVNLETMMDLMEQVTYKCAMAVNGTPIVKYGDKEFDVAPPWRKIDMTQAVIDATGIPFDKIDSDEEAIEAAKKYGMTLENEADWSRGKIIAEMFEDYCENIPGFLDGPCFVCAVNAVLTDRPERLNMSIAPADQGKRMRDILDPDRLRIRVGRLKMLSGISRNMISHNSPPLTNDIENPASVRCLPNHDKRVPSRSTSLISHFHPTIFPRCFL